MKITEFDKHIKKHLKGFKLWWQIAKEKRAIAEHKENIRILKRLLEDK